MKTFIALRGINPHLRHAYPWNKLPIIAPCLSSSLRSGTNLTVLKSTANSMDMGGSEFILVSAITVYYNTIHLE